MSSILTSRLFDHTDATVEKSIGYVLKRNPDGISMEFADGTTIWIEREDGRIRVHNCRPGQDAPLNVEIYADRIEVDDHDYRMEAGA